MYLTQSTDLKGLEMEEKSISLKITEEMQTELDRWNRSDLNAQNPDAITITSFFRALRESRRQLRSQSDFSGQSDQLQGSEQRRIACTNI
jgi:hypothetical protein